MIVFLFKIKYNIIILYSKKFQKSQKQEYTDP